MKDIELYTLYEKHNLAGQIIDAVKNNSDRKIFLKGLAGSSKSLLSAGLIKSSGNNAFIILPDKEEAAYFYSDITNIISESNVFFFPPSFKRSVQYFQPDTENIVLRTNALREISYNKTGQSESKPIIIVSYPEAIIEKVITHENLKKNTLNLRKNEKISIEFINEVLDEYKFQFVDFVIEPGQYSIRGSIVDIYSFASELPYRIDFFGNEVDSIRSFNPETQLSADVYENIAIIPNIQDITTEQIKETIFDFIPDNFLIISTDYQYFVDRINEIYNNTDPGQYAEIIPNKKTTIDEFLTTGNNVAEKLKQLRCIEIGHHCYFNPDITFEFSTIPQPNFNKNFELLGNDLKEHYLNGYATYIISESHKQIERLTAIFNEINHEVTFKPVYCALHEGFIDHDLKICCYTDHQIFERFHRYKIRKFEFDKSSITLKEIFSLQPGDYVVHVDHGIGRFGGLEKIEINGKIQESVRLVYKDNDILYVSIHSLHRIAKYKGKEGDVPKIYKLGSGAWQKLKQNTKNKIKDIARDLISLYAKRKSIQGFQFSPDSYLQAELEASFIYEDTPDQEKATKIVKDSMESSVPMDMLVCGDVGFGKTEIAIRVAFKAVADSKQVAVLVPTTILALQHFNTFSERLDKFPCNIDVISRLKSPGAQKETVKKLEEGKIDIIIGTHRLVSKDIKFKNLGLLVIDEEQKFGVSLKEKLRQFQANIDTLTITATPIPRTLQFSLMGARDLAIINTPPPNRQPIETELHTFNEEIIKEAIVFEIEREGQVFFINNRVQNLAEIEKLVNRIVPYAKTAVAHGQLEPEKLEKVMLDFIGGRFDVLISTAIIESGLDIPNANTIIVNNAHQFGLSDLHQLRGRVGRSNKKAFCYLLAPPVSILTPDARRRLKAIEDFSDLGSGFQIALQDLDIRGAGNLLGAEQSGFIADIGFDTYQRILNEAIQELKESEFSGVFTDEMKSGLPYKFSNDCQIDSDFEIMFPEDYISSTSERIRLYRELDNLQNEEELTKFKGQLQDRFGNVPPQTEGLLNIVRIRWLAIKLGFEKVILKNNVMVIYFISDKNSPFYQSKLFGKLLYFIQKQGKKYLMKDEKNKLTLTIQEINNSDKALNILKQIINDCIEK